MRVRPVSPQLLVAELVERLCLAPSDQWLRVAVDGAPPSSPADLADALVDPLRVLGRTALRVSAEHFLRPASLRLEHGREDPDAFYDDRLDVAALMREVLDPLGPQGSGRYLPSLWDAGTDRATRAPYAVAPPGAILLLDGALLLGRWLPLDLTVHLSLSPAALARRMPAHLQWTLPAYQRYAEDVGPEKVADVAVRVNDPRRPAVVEPP